MPNLRYPAAALIAALVLGATACGGHSGAAPDQTVGDLTARHLLIQGFEAARAVAVEDHLCGGCYLDETGEITEEMNGRSGGQYAIAFTPFGAHLPGVVYLDTVGASRLTRRHITLYSRTSNGTVWRLDAGRGAPQLTVAE